MRISSLKNQVLFRFIVICCGASFVYCDEPTNVSKSAVEIDPKKIFSAEKKPSVTVNIPSGPPNHGNKIYTEGSSSTVNAVLPHFKNGNHDDTTSMRTDINQLIKNNAKHNTSINSENSTNVDSKNSNMLNDTHSNLLLEVNGSFHGSGMSSIKPRKGVEPSKVVPRKGVVFQNEPLDGHFCFSVNQTICYDVESFKNIECSCCETGNDLGKTVSQQPLINCSICSPVNKVNDVTDSCKGICCNFISNISDDPVKMSAVRVHNVKSYAVTDDDIKDYKSASFKNLGNASRQNEIVDSSKKSKLKPSVTKVPHDKDVVNTNPFSKSKGEKYVPIIVSIFILPLVGILIFFIWKKTREVWDRRYYKRMDFLIDGMYND